MERALRRFRDRTLRRRHGGGGTKSRKPDPLGPATLRGRRRRHRCRPRPCGRGRGFYLCVYGRRRLPGMAGRQGTPGRPSPEHPIRAPDKKFASEEKMNRAELNKIANKMVAPGKGLLAADESTGTIQKRFDKIGVANTEENRRDYREMLFRTDKSMREHISGVILYDETLRQKAKDGTPFVTLIEAAGAVPGIKVDAGAKPLAGAPGETITEGLDGLRERFVEYHKLGARFAKWRAVIDIGAHIPSYNCINANAQALARYAALAQENGIVPIVEPEVLMDGDHDIQRCEDVTSWILSEVFEALYLAGVKLEGMILKPN